MDIIFRNHNFYIVFGNVYLPFVIDVTSVRISRFLFSILPQTRSCPILIITGILSMTFSMALIEDPVKDLK